MRAAIYQKLSNDANVLAALNSTIQNPNIYPNFAMDQRPVNDASFLVIRFGTRRAEPGHRHGACNMELWAYVPAAISTDFVKVDAILGACDAALLEASDGQYSAGGYTITDCHKIGEGIDYQDNGYKAITRSATYSVLSRLTITVVPDPGGNDPEPPVDDTLYPGGNPGQYPAAS